MLVTIWRYTSCSRSAGNKTKILFKSPQFLAVPVTVLRNLPSSEFPAGSRQLLSSNLSLNDHHLANTLIQRDSHSISHRCIVSIHAVRYAQKQFSLTRSGGVQPESNLQPLRSQAQFPGPLHSTLLPKASISRETEPTTVKRAAFKASQLQTESTSH